MKRPTLSAMLTAAILFAAGTAYGQTTVMRVADSFPVGHPTAENMTKYWMDAVTKATNGAVKFEYYPATQLGKPQDLLALTLRGVADISGFVPSNVPDKMPLSAVAELPGGFATSCQGTTAYYRLIRDGILAKDEFRANGVRALFTIVLPPYQLFASKPLTRLKDADGLKIRTLGGAHDITLRKIDAVPVRLGAPELYDSLARGTLDGVIVPHRTILNYKWNDHVKFGTIGENLGSGLTTYVISETRWNKLPESVQKIMLEVGADATRRTCEYYDRDVGTAMETLKKEGMTLVEWPAEDRKRLEPLLASVGAEWAESLEKRGKPGKAVLDAFRKELRQ